MIRKKSLIKIALSFSVAIALVSYLWTISTQPVDTALLPSTSPKANNPVPDFKVFDDVKQKKAAFFAYLKPEIELQNEHILGVRHQLQQMLRKVQNTELLSHRESKKIEWLANEYRVITPANENKGLSEAEILTLLIIRVDIIPVELVLVQAANESAWGTSRFAKNGYNFFGLWCFVKGCGFVPSRRSQGSSHEVAKFDNLTDAVYSYLRNLNRHDAYKELRAIRAQLRNSHMPVTGNALAEGLTSYSERGSEYVEEIQAMIRINKRYFSE